MALNVKPSVVPGGNQQTFEFTFGDLKCVLFAEAHDDYPIPWIFDVDGKEQNRRDDLFDKATHFTLPYTILYVDTGTKKLVFDAGWGKYGDEYGINSRMYERIQERVNPADVDYVIISHFHVDHFGILVGRDGKSFFPNAAVVMGKTDHETWGDKTRKSIPSDYMGVTPYVLKDLWPIVDEVLDVVKHQIKYVEKTGRTEIVPGIVAHECGGHSDGHIIIELTSKGQTLIATGDAYLHPESLNNPEWSSVFDQHMGDARIVRKNLIPLILRPNVYIWANHFPFPSIGTVTQDRDNKLKFNMITRSKL